MREKDRTEFVQLLTAAAEMKRVELSEAAIELYWDALADLSLDDFKRGLRSCLRTLTFLPQPNEIIAATGGDPETLALAAWSKVDNAVDRYWPHRSVVFDDPLIHAVIRDMGGWYRLGQHEDREWPFVQKEFERRYGIYLKTRPEEYPGMLRGNGLPLATVNAEGELELKAEAPALIGDCAACQRVLTAGLREVKRLGPRQAREFIGETRAHLAGREPGADDD